MSVLCVTGVPVFAEAVLFLSLLGTAQVMSVLCVTGVPVLAEAVLFLSQLGTAPGDVCAV